MGHGVVGITKGPDCTSDEPHNKKHPRTSCEVRGCFVFVELRSSLLPLGVADTSIALLSLTRSLFVLGLPNIFGVHGVVVDFLGTEFDLVEEELFVFLVEHVLQAKVVDHVGLHPFREHDASALVVEVTSGL